MGGKLQQRSQWIAESHLDEIAGDALSDFRGQLAGFDGGRGEGHIHLCRCDVMVEFDVLLYRVIDDRLLVDFLHIA